MGYNKKRDTLANSCNESYKMFITLITCNEGGCIVFWLVLQELPSLREFCLVKELPLTQAT